MGSVKLGKNRITFSIIREVEKKMVKEKKEVNKTEARKKLSLGGLSGLFKSKKTKQNMQSEKTSRGRTLDADTSSRAGDLPSKGHTNDAGSVASTRSRMSLTMSRSRKFSRRQRRSHNRVRSGQEERTQENLSIKNTSRILRIDAGSAPTDDRPRRSLRSQRSSRSRGRLGWKALDMKLCHADVGEAVENFVGQTILCGCADSYQNDVTSIALVDRADSVSVDSVAM